MPSNALSVWLADLGLERYALVFEEQGIDLRSLRLLTDCEFAELGVLLGHRKLLLNAIAELKHQEPPALTSVNRDAERRQLTVLFCDLVGSTPLAQRLDPEALRDLMRAYQAACGSAVEPYDGHVAQYRGDSLEIYFGWPQAHEDDAERAVRAALEIVPAVGRVPASERLRVRIGIATGQVVVGTSGAGDASIPSAAVGETPNLAARLQALAGPDQIIVAPSTHHLLGQIFDVEDLGGHELKGISGLVQVRRVRGLAHIESRFDAIRDERFTPFVGREHEVALLLARWEQAVEGEGQVVVLAGEAGIGKSRITRVLRERLASTPHQRLHCQCSPYHSGSAYFPLIEHFERAAGFQRDDTTENKLDRLEAVLGLGPEALPVVAPLFAALLSLPTDRYPARMLSPQKHQELTIAALADYPGRLAQRLPVLVICEDAQWIDPFSLEIMALTVERIRHAPVLVVITCRSDFVPNWTAHGNVSVLNLNRLSKRHVAAMAVGLAESNVLPASLLEQIVERADGVPLFVEELTKTVLELHLLHNQGGRWTARSPLPPLAIPATLQDSLMARLDRLESVRDLAQIGACIGREFDLALLSAVAPLRGQELQRALDGLVASGLVFLHSTAAEAVYSFKHSLIRDVAYDGLLKSRRQQIHERIARALASEFKDRAKSHPELLALHFTRAELIDLALPYWRIAMRAAIKANRHREALGYVDAGLALVDRASAESRTNIKVRLLTTGAACHWVLNGYTRESADLMGRAEALLGGVTDDRLLFLALGGIVVSAGVRVDVPKALAAAEQLVSLGEATLDVNKQVFCFAWSSVAFAHQGQFERSRRLLEFVVFHYEYEKRSVYGGFSDPKATACAWLSWVHMSTGRLDQARRYAHTAIDHATAIAQPFVLSEVLSICALPFAEAGDYEVALLLCSRCIDLCDTQHLPYWRGWAMAIESVAIARLGDYGRGEAMLAQAIAHLVLHGHHHNFGYVYARRTHMLALLGRFDEARREHKTGCAECVQTGQPLMLSELAHARGMTELLDPGADAGAAEHWLQLALTDARSTGMRLTELRAAIALAGLWQLQRKDRLAQALLAPIFGGFTEGFDSLDLRNAKMLLDDLAATSRD